MHKALSSPLLVSNFIYAYSFNLSFHSLWLLLLSFWLSSFFSASISNQSFLQTPLWHYHSLLFLIHFWIPLSPLPLLSSSLYLVSPLTPCSHVPVTFPGAALSKLFFESGTWLSCWNNGKFNKSQRESAGMNPRFLSTDLLCTHLRRQPWRGGEKNKGTQCVLAPVCGASEENMCERESWKWDIKLKKKGITRNLISWTLCSFFVLTQIFSKLKQQGFLGSKDLQKCSHHVSCGFICSCEYEWC